MIFGIGLKIIVPKQVLEELERVSEKKNKKLEERSIAELSLRVLKKNAEKINFINLGKKHVDKLIIEYATKHPTLIVATLDSELKKKIKNRKMVIRLKKKIEII